MANYISIDIGGTHTRIARSDFLKQPELKDKIIFPTSTNFEKDFEKITEYIENKTYTDGIGISIPGRLNENKTCVIDGNDNTISYKDQPIVQILRDKYHCDVRMDNDAAVAGLGEAYLGNSDKADFIFIIWGTGVGGAYVNFENGTVVSRNIERNIFLSSWEESFGGKNIEMKYGKPADDFGDLEWDIIFTNLEEAILASKNYLNTSKIIFGGGISMKQNKRLIKLEKKLSTYYPDLPKIQLSKLGEDAGLLGAIQLFR